MRKDRNNALAKPFLPLTNTRKDCALVPDRIMITILIDDCNSFSQKTYDEYVFRLQPHRMKCKCGRCGGLIFYGHYERKLKLLGLFLSIIIQRVRCSFCGKTHALIPSLIVPYSQIPREDQQEILKLNDEGKTADSVLNRNCQIDESNVRHIIRRYKRFWKERILSLGLSLRDRLTETCLSVYSLQFMQNHRTWNSLFSPPT
mgnify:CR=1 FL=1